LRYILNISGATQFTRDWNLPSTRLPSSCRWKVLLAATAAWRTFIVARQERKGAALVSPASFLHTSGRIYALRYL
jgi:hypothetical protein